MILPNTILLGAQKAGTTSLFNWIGQHPDVFAPPGMKDYEFFSRDDVFSQNLFSFSKAFSRHSNEKIILHGCTNYIYFSKKSSERISQTIPDARMLLVLRNPIDRAYSAYWDARKVAVETCLSFEDAIDLEQKRIEHGNFKEISSLTYISHGFYARQIEWYYKVFSKDKIKIILFDDIKNSPLDTIREIFYFLEIEENFQPNFQIKNEAGLPKSVALQKLLQKVKMPKIIRPLIPIEKVSDIKTKIIRNLNVKRTGYPQMNNDTYSKLYEVYKKEIEALEVIIKKDLSGWLNQ